MTVCYFALYRTPDDPAEFECWGGMDVVTMFTAGPTSHAGPTTGPVAG